MSVDPNRPSAARVYDCFLGGSHNFAVDRAVAERVIALVPEIPAIMKANRAFLRRVVRYAAARGIDQFLDIGSGIPTEGNVHEVAQAARPGARVVYVDIDPTAVIHARQLLGDDPLTTVVQADLHETDRILTDPAVTGLLDLRRPVCMMLLAMLHFSPDTAALRVNLERYRAALAPGSLLAVTHATASAREGQVNDLTDVYVRTGTPMVTRDRGELLALFEGWDLIEPGLVYSPLWHPDPDDPPVADPASLLTYVGVGVRP